MVPTPVSGVPEGSQRGPPRVEQTPLVFLFLCTAMVSGRWGTDCLKLVQYYTGPLEVAKLQASWLKPQVKPQLQGTREVSPVLGSRRIPDNKNYGNHTMSSLCLHHVSPVCPTMTPFFVVGFLSQEQARKRQGDRQKHPHFKDRETEAKRQSCASSGRLVAGSAKTISALAFPAP